MPACGGCGLGAAGGRADRGGGLRGADIALLALAAVAVVAWEWLCARSELSGAQQAAPVAVLAAALVSLTVLSGWSSPVAGAIARWSA